MTEATDKPFTPPTASQVEAHLAANPPRRPTRAIALAPLVALSAAFALMLTVDHPLLLALPWVLLVGVLVGLSERVRRLRRREAELNGVQELTLLRRHVEALRATWGLLPQVTSAPELHGRAVALIGHNLAALRASEAAIAALGYLVERLPAEHPMSVQLQIQRAVAQLESDQLIDADDALRRLRQVEQAYAGTPLAAAYRLAVLLQQVRTHHDADAVAEADALAAALRPLGVEAGYGHALLALALHRLGHEDARAWWSRATLLVPAPTLLRRFADLAPLAELPVEPWPVTPARV